MAESIGEKPYQEKGPDSPDYKEKLKDAEAVFVLDCDIKKAGKGGFERFKSTSFADADAHGFLSGGHARVIAAAEIAENFPDLKLVTTSYYKQDDPVHAEIYKRELEGMGIPEEQIETEVKSRSTLGELVEMVKMAKRKEWKKVAILTSDYHAERVQAMCEHLSELAERLNLSDEEFRECWDSIQKGDKLEITILQAEEILLIRDPRYAAIIKKVKNSDSYRKRVEAEKRGIQQINDGTYGKK